MRRQPFAAPTEGTDPYLPGHGDASYDVSHYDLELEYKVDSNLLKATAHLRATAQEDLTRLSLDLAGLRVSKVTMTGGSVAKFVTRRGKLVVTTRQPVRAGHDFTLTIRYGGNPRPYDGAGWEELTDGVIVAGQPGGAPSWFACNDRPDDKASYRITVTAASEYYVVANGTLASTTRRATATTWVYEQDEPMATYLATVQIGRYAATVTARSPVPIRVVAPEGARDQVLPALSRQPEMMELFVDLFGDYPFAEYTAVVTADALEIPLEAQGMSVFGSNALSMRWEDERLVAHELAHQWFGNSLTVRRWQDIWLHEGFACYAEWLWSEESGQRSADEQAREHHRRLGRLRQDLVLADPGPELMFDDRLYKRGALALHALRLTLGDEVFFAILQEWVSEHAYGTVTTDDFTDLVATHADRPVGPLLQRWLWDERLPDLPA